MIQVVLAGQPELEHKLSQPNLRQLRERIAVRAKIWPLSRTDSIAYINHRLSKVLLPDSKPIFTRSALKCLAGQAKGNPRRLNILCDSALLAGFSYQKRPVPWSVAWEVRSGVNRPPNWRHATVTRALAIVGVIAMAVGLAVYGSYWITDNAIASQSSAVGITNQRTSEQPVVQIISSPSESASASALVDGNVIPPFVDSDTDLDIVANTVNLEATPEPTDVAGVRNGIDSHYSFESETVAINKGDGLWQLSRDIYGDVDSEIVQGVIAANPNIRDPDNLEIRQEIVFPSLAVLGKSDATRVTKTTLED